jgi:excisionase family DNA binding protein
VKGKRRAISGLLLGVKEASQLLGNSERSMRALIAQGVVPYKKLAGRIVFKRSELESFVEGLPGVSMKEARENVKARQ